MPTGYPVHRVVNVRQCMVTRIAAALHSSETRLRATEWRRRQFFDRLAQRLALAADLPLPLAHKQVMALAISARDRLAALG
jgi:hypothetical protein